MLKFKSLTAKEKLEFKEKYEIYNSIPMAYLNNSTVIGAFKKGIMYGGYVINTRLDNSRYISCISNQVDKDKIVEFLRNDFCELSCTWRDKEKCHSVGEKLQLFVHAIITAYRTNKKFTLGGSSEIKIRQIQQLIMNRNLWEGHGCGPAHDKYIYLYYAINKSILIKLVNASFIYILVMLKIKRLSST